MRRLAAFVFAGAALAAPAVAAAQQTRDVGLPPPFDTPALPPAVNPALPPQTGQRYLPGTSGPFADPDRPLVPLRRGATGTARPPESVRGTVRLSQAAQPAQRINSVQDLWGALRACWVAPAIQQDGGLDATIRISLARSGQLVGEPRVTYVSRKATTAQRDAIVASMRAALARCAPLPLTDRFGGSIAGRPLFIRFFIDASSAR